MRTGRIKKLKLPVELKVSPSGIDSTIEISQVSWQGFGGS